MNGVCLGEPYHVRLTRNVSEPTNILKSFGTIKAKGHKQNSQTRRRSHMY